MLLGLCCLRIDRTHEQTEIVNVFILVARSATHKGTFGALPTVSAAQVRPPTVGRHFARATCAEDLPIPETVLELDLETMTCAAGLAANAVAIRRTGIQVPLDEALPCHPGTRDVSIVSQKHVLS